MNTWELICKNCNAKNKVNKQDDITMCECCDHIIVVNEMEYKAKLHREGEQILKEREEINKLYNQRKRDKNDLIDKIQKNIWNKEVGILYYYALGILLIPFFGIGLLVLLYVKKVEEKVGNEVRKADVEICEMDKKIVRINNNAAVKKHEMESVNKKLHECYRLTEG